MTVLYVDNTPYPGHHAGTAQGGGSGTTHIILAASCNEIDDALNDYGITIIAGTGVGQSRQITDYVASTKTATVDREWEAAVPNNTSVYAITVGADTNDGTAQGKHSGGHGAWANLMAITAFERDVSGATVNVKAGTIYNAPDADGRIFSAVTAIYGFSPMAVIRGYKDTPGDSDDPAHWGDPAYQFRVEASLVSGVCFYFTSTEESARDVNLEIRHALMTAGAFGVFSADKEWTRRIRFVNCKAENIGADGWSGGYEWEFLACKGIGGGTGFSVYKSVLEKCEARGNAAGTEGQFNVSDCTLIECLGLASGGVPALRYYGECTAIRCTFLGGTNQRAVVAAEDAGALHLYGNIIDAPTAVNREELEGAQAGDISAMNVIHGTRTNWPLGPSDVTDDPLLVDPDNGDYRPCAASPARGLFSGSDAGAFQGVSASGGGSPTNRGMQV